MELRFGTLLAPTFDAILPPVCANLKLYQKDPRGLCHAAPLLYHIRRVA